MIDLHNDLITDVNLSVCDKMKQIQTDIKNGASVCYSIFLHGKNEEYLNSFSWSKYLKNLSIEDIGGVDDISEILSFRPSFVTLTWNTNNKYAGGALDDGNLTALGCRAIDFLDDNGIALDLSHLNRKSFENAIKRANRVLVSHTCCDKIRQNKRNLTNEQIQAVIDKNGIIGLCFYADFLTDKNQATIDVAHIDYFCSRFSFRNLAIGTDYFGMENGVVGLASYSDFYKIEERLTSLGYSAKVISAIIHNNAQSFLRNAKTSPNN